MPEFGSLFERLSPAQVDEILDGQLSSDKTAESRSSTLTKRFGPADGKKSEVDRAFDELVAG